MLEGHGHDVREVCRLLVRLGAVPREGFSPGEIPMPVIRDGIRDGLEMWLKRRLWFSGSGWG